MGTYLYFGHMYILNLYILFQVIDMLTILNFTLVQASEELHAQPLSIINMAIHNAVGLSFKIFTTTKLCKCHQDVATNRWHHALHLVAIYIQHQSTHYPTLA